MPSLEGGGDQHRRRREQPEPRVLGREDRDRRERQRLQARPRLLQRHGRAGPGPRTAELRVDAQREDGHGPDRREQLPLRRPDPELRRRLPHVADVVEELLQRRFERDRQLHGVERRDADREHQGRDPQHPPGDGERGIRRLRVHDDGADLLVADTGRVGASATRSPVTRVRARAAAVCGTPTRTGPTTPRWPPSTTRCATRWPRPG